MRQPSESFSKALLEIMRSVTGAATHGCRLSIDRQCVLMDLNNLLT